MIDEDLISAESTSFFSLSFLAIFRVDQDDAAVGDDVSSESSGETF